MLTFLRRFDARLALTILVSASACEDGTVVREVPKLVLTPAVGETIDFGTVAQDATVDHFTVQIANQGTAALVFSSIGVEGSDQLAVMDMPASLGPNLTTTMKLLFTPTVAGPLVGAVVFRSNDPDLPEARLEVAATVEGECALALSPSSATFLIGESKTFVLQNTSASSCSVVRVESDETLFPIDMSPSVPFPLGASESIDLAVSHSAAAFVGRPQRRLTVRAVGGASAVSTLLGEARSSCLSLEEDVLYFGARLGDRIVRTARLTSTCTHQVTITTASIQSPTGGFEVDENVLPIVIAPGTTGELDVTFAPPLDPEFSSVGTLTIETDDITDRLFDVRLSGRVAEARGRVTPAALDFGFVPYAPSAGPGSPSVCGSPPKDLTVLNTSIAPLTVTTVDLTQAEPYEIGYIDVDGVRLSTTAVQFDVLEQANIGIRFRPTALATQPGRILVDHDGMSTVANVDVTGTGETLVQITDARQQPVRIAADILWSIDASCSMGQEQQNLIDNLSQFVGYADAQGVDYQMAVIVAEVSPLNASQGIFRTCPPHPAVISSTYLDGPGREAAFACLFNVGTSGRYPESGLGAADTALMLASSSDQDPRTNPNAGFLRRDAELVIITISDDNDQSQSPNIVLRDRYYAAKNNQRNRVSVYAIAADVPGGCPGAAAPGTRYLEMTQATGGQFHSICEPDWSPVLRSLSTAIFVPQDRWTLSRTPDPTTLEVTVDGAVVPKRPVDGWTYGATLNEVLFTGTAVPAPGAQILITYRPLCLR